MARWTKKLIREQFEWTNACYRQALLDVYGHLLSDDEKDCLDERMIRINVVNKLQALYGAPPDFWNAPVNEAYLFRLRKLPTDQIELIIEAYSKGKMGRSPLTMDVLLSELMERAINSETKTRHE